MNSKFILALAAFLAIGYSATAPWIENYFLQRFIREDLQIGSTQAEVERTLAENGYEYVMNDGVPAPNLSKDRWMQAWIEKKSVLYGTYYLRINLYFLEGPDRLADVDALVSFRNVL